MKLTRICTEELYNLLDVVMRRPSNEETHLELQWRLRSAGFDKWKHRENRTPCDVVGKQLDLAESLAYSWLGGTGLASSPLLKHWQGLKSIAEGRLDPKTVEQRDFVQEIILFFRRNVVYKQPLVTTWLVLHGLSWLFCHTIAEVSSH